MNSKWKKWQCRICGWIYDEELGDPDSGIAPGTAWEDVPDDWRCPDCGASKDEFDMVELRERRFNTATGKTDNKHIEGKIFADITLGADHEGIAIDPVEQVVTFADGERRYYRNIVVVTGSGTKRITSADSGATDQVVKLNDGLEAPAAASRLPGNFTDRLLAWWWG